MEKILKTAKVTVIIPCYNSVSSVLPTFQLKLQQRYKTLKNIPAIVSFNHTYITLIKPFINNKNAIYVIKQRNHGCSNPRYAAVNKATTACLFYLNLDVMLQLQFTLLYLKKIIKNTDVIQVYATVIKCKA